MTWELLHPDMTAEALGLLPLMLSEEDMRSARDQLQWHCAQHSKPVVFTTWGFTFNPKTYSLKADGTAINRPLAKSSLRDETILFYRFSWLVIMQPDDSYVVARIG